MSSDICPSDIMAACGIAHTLGPRFPYDASVGLSIGGGKPITGADWFRFLETRTLRPASELPPGYGRYRGGRVEVIGEGRR